MDFILERYKLFQKEVDVTERLANPLNKDLSPLKLYLKSIDVVIDSLDYEEKIILEGVIEGDSSAEIGLRLRMSRDMVNYRRRVNVPIEFMTRYNFLLDNIVGGEFNDIFPKFKD